MLFQYQRFIHVIEANLVSIRLRSSANDSFYESLVLHGTADLHVFDETFEVERIDFPP